MARIYDHTWLIGEWERMGRPDIEFYSTYFKKWCDICMENCFWNDNYQYRIKSKPWINWEHVDKAIMWLSTGSDGYYLFIAEPSYDSLKWFNEYSAYYRDASAFASFTPGTCAWQDSLVMRPVYRESE